jgi:hypothetical protein
MSCFRALRAVSLSALLCLASNPARVAADAHVGPPPGAGPAGGSYEGQVYNGDDMDPVLTVFSRSPGGSWTGSYVLGEEDDVEVGQLDACTWETMLLITCRWTDRHGVGFARLLFSSDYRAFRGFWGNTMDALSLPWDGSRE